MASKTLLLAAALCAVALAGCTAGDDSGGGSDGGNTTAGGGVGVGGTVSGPAGNASGNVSVSGSSTMTSTNSTSGGNGTLEPPLAADVSIEGNRFVNDTVTIRVGGTVTWTHNDGATTPHTVTADDGSFDSSPNCSPPLTAIGDCMTQGDTFSATFATPGTYTYHCKVHPSMTGTVNVVA